MIAPQNNIDVAIVEHNVKFVIKEWQQSVVNIFEVRRQNVVNSLRQKSPVGMHVFARS